MAEEKKDWVPAAALGVGVVGVATGLYFYLKKPKGVDQGDIIAAIFTFDYSGEGGTYVIQVSLGRIFPLNIFDHIEGLTWDKEIELPGPGHYEEELECELPEAIKPQTYDAEALIKTPEMDKLQYIVKVLTQDAITVRKD